MSKLIPEGMLEVDILNAIKQPNFTAASTDFENAHRESIIGDADNIAWGEYLFIQGRCRYMVRNNSIAASARKKAVEGLGNIRIKWQNLDGTKHELMQTLYEEFAENPMLDGKGDIDCLVAVERGERFEVGEAIGRMYTYKSKSKLPLKIQMIPSEYLDISYRGNGTEGQDYTRYGITFDKKFNIIPDAYNFLPEQYYGINPKGYSEFERIKIRADNILHSFNRQWAGQWRGLPVLTPSLIEMYQLSDLKSATVMQQISCSLISWVVDQLPQSMSKDAGGTVKMLGELNSSDENKKLFFANKSGTVQYVEGGGKFNMVQSRDIGSNLVVMLQNSYRNIAASLNEPYYSLTGDTDGLDFSTIRALLIEKRKKVEFDFNVIEIPYFLAPIAKRLKDLALALNYKVEDAIPIYEFPRWYGVDDLKDFQAYVLGISSGIIPIQAVWQLLGFDESQIIQSKLWMEENGFGHLVEQTDTLTTNNSKPSSQASSN